MMEYLSGGRANIQKNKQFVYRPKNDWTINVHDFLAYLHAHEFKKVPKPIEIQANEEVVSFVEGRVYHDPYPAHFYTNELLISAAKLLAEYHKVAAPYCQQLTGNECWMLKHSEKNEVMCHGDYAPYNVTVIGGLAVGMIDFDTIHPGTRLEDIAYAVYRWTPLSCQDTQLTFTQKMARSKLFLDAYGLKKEERRQLIQVLDMRLSNLIVYMTTQALVGNKTFQQHIQAGHLAVYLEDQKFLLANQ